MCTEDTQKIRIKKLIYEHANLQRLHQMWDYFDLRQRYTQILLKLQENSKRVW